MIVKRGAASASQLEERDDFFSADEKQSKRSFITITFTDIAQLSIQETLRMNCPDHVSQTRNTRA